MVILMVQAARVVIISLSSCLVIEALIQMYNIWKNYTKEDFGYKGTSLQEKAKLSYKT